MIEHQARRWKRPGFTTTIIIGFVVGIAWGLFWGESGSWVKCIGDAYIGLLQMAVLPYVALSLTCNIGRLSGNQVGRLARVAVSVLVLLWVIGLLALGVMTLSFPSWQGGSFFSVISIEESASPNWLELFIPSNVFWSLTHNLVPAVVLFSIGLGVALIQVPEKKDLLDKLDILIEGLSRLNRLVVRLSPIGIFAIVGHTTGTISLGQFGLLQAYILTYGMAALLLSLWTLPALIACCTPLSQREVLAAARDVLMTAFIIGNTFVVLPMIIDAVNRLIKRHQLDMKDAPYSPRYTVPLAYPFPDIGRIVGVLFIPFAAWFYGTQIDSSSYPALVGTGFLGAFAKPVVTMPLLLDLAHIPADIFNLYIASGVVTSRFGDLIKAMHLFTFSVLTAWWLVGAIHIDLRRTLRMGLSTAFLFVVTIVGIRGVLTHSFGVTHKKENLLHARELFGAPVQFTVLEKSNPNPMSMTDGEDPIERIRRRGVVRIGFRPDETPFTYYNLDGQLVGFDIDMAHELARDLGVRIEFVPFSGEVTTLLQADHFDIAMSGLEGTIQRATSLPHIQPYMEVAIAFVVPDHRRRDFRSREQVEHQPDLRVAVVAGTRAADAREQFPKIEFVELANEREFYESQPPVADILVTSAEAGSAWTLRHPQFAVVKPTDVDVRVPLYYFVATKSRLEESLENWLDHKLRDGTIQELYDYWILGKDRPDQTPRWSIVRNVLHIDL